MDYSKNIQDYLRRFADAVEEQGDVLTAIRNLLKDRDKGLEVLEGISTFYLDSRDIDLIAKAAQIYAEIGRSYIETGNGQAKLADSYFEKAREAIKKARSLNDPAQKDKPPYDRVSKNLVSVRYQHHQRALQYENRLGELERSLE